MKMTTMPQDTATATIHDRSESQNRREVPALTAEEKLTARVFQAGNGKGLMKFCRELAVILIRRYSIDDEARDLRSDLCASLEATLKCSNQQANCLIDLSLEMIHAKVHGNYRRSDIELGYLIATATGAVKDVRSN